MYIRDNVLHAKVLNYPGIYVNSRNRHGSTPVSSVLILHNKKTFQVAILLHIQHTISKLTLTKK